MHPLAVVVGAREATSPIFWPSMSFITRTAKSASLGSVPSPFIHCDVVATKLALQASNGALPS